jgi:hypothetical protein
VDSAPIDDVPSAAGAASVCPVDAVLTDPVMWSSSDPACTSVVPDVR